MTYFPVDQMKIGKESTGSTYYSLYIPSVVSPNHPFYLIGYKTGSTSPERVNPQYIYLYDRYATLESSGAGGESKYDIVKFTEAEKDAIAKQYSQMSFQQEKNPEYYKLYVPPGKSLPLAQKPSVETTSSSAAHVSVQKQETPSVWKSIGSVFKPIEIPKISETIKIPKISTGSTGSSTFALSKTTLPKSVFPVVAIKSQKQDYSRWILVGGVTAAILGLFLIIARRR